jgi:sugar/nucleoside kinase (ribokinase family)
MRRLAAVGKLNKDYHFLNVVPGEKNNFDRTAWGGGPLVAAPTMAALGLKVDLMSRHNSSHATELQAVFESTNVTFCSETIKEPVGVNAVLGDGTVLRIVPTADLKPSRSEAYYLGTTPLDAIALCGSMPDQYADFWVQGAAARGISVFWNASSSADLSLCANGANVLLQVSFIEFVKRVPASCPEDLARCLLGLTGAQAVCVTDGSGESIGIHRSRAEVIRKRAFALQGVVRKLGAGDAHFGGFVAAWLSAPANTRLERAMSAGRIAGARHVMGLPPGNWSELREFELQRICDAVERAA